MKLLVETHHTQGQRSNDFNNCNPGELVRFASTCDRDEGDPDGFSGRNSRSSAQGEPFTAAGQTLVRSITPNAHGDKVWADDPDTGKRRVCVLL